MNSRKLEVIALDLEGVLISNAASQIPRPGLFDFLTRCELLCSKVVIFTTVREEKFRSISDLLVREGHAPTWFGNIEYINWSGQTKDLRFISCVDWTNIILIDDFFEYVHPGQEANWIRATQFDYQHPEIDEGFADVLERIGIHAAKLRN